MVAKGAYTAGSKAPPALQGRMFSSYYQYQNARAQAEGHPSYAAQRRAEGIGNPLVRFMIDRGVFGPARMSRADATRQVREWYRSQGYKGGSLPAGDRRYSTEQGRRKHFAIAWMQEHGYDLSADDRDDAVPY